jgi:hypothetical protein
MEKSSAPNSSRVGAWRALPLEFRVAAGSPAPGVWVGPVQPRAGGSASPIAELLGIHRCIPVREQCRLAIEPHKPGDEARLRHHLLAEDRCDDQPRIPGPPQSDRDSYVQPRPRAGIHDQSALTAHPIAGGWAVTARSTGTEAHDRWRSRIAAREVGGSVTRSSSDPRALHARSGPNPRSVAVSAAEAVPVAAPARRLLRRALRFGATLTGIGLLLFGIPWWTLLSLALGGPPPFSWPVRS